MATSTIKPKCGTTAQWEASGRVLEVNEWGVEITESGEHILRIGDGEHRFHELPTVVDTPMLHELEANVESLHNEVVVYNTAAATSAGNAAASASQAKSTLDGVQSALDNLPAGDTLVINDLTTGGTAAALSAEMGRMLARRPKQNLLHNWYFLNLVNQRGQSEYETYGYIVDRWRLTKMSSVTENTVKAAITAGGLLIENTSLSAQGWLRQDFERELPDGTYTVSVLVTDVGYCDHYDDVTDKRDYAATFGLISSSGSYGTNRSISAPGLHVLTRKVSSSEPYNRNLRFVFAPGRKVTIAAVKVEMGDVQTLAHQDASGNWVLNEIPDYGEELLKCQRYYQLFASEDAMPKNLVDYRPAMRANPATGTIDIDGATYWYADANL